MIKWFERQLEKIRSPRLDWIQVEITTGCNSSCIYCPHTILVNHWKNVHMTLALFRKLIPFIHNTKLIFLQGWGEPLLNKDIFDMIRICKDHGKRVGFTTNGMLLNEKTVRKLIELKTDILAVSLAGTTPVTHNRIRKGTEFDRVISNLERLSWIKQEMRSPVPELNLAYLMLASNFHELKEIIPHAKRVGASQIVASNLSLILEPELFSEAIFNDTDRIDYYTRTLEETQTMAEREGIVFDYNRINLNNASLRCSENVCYSCVVNVQGDVMPCVFFNPVLSVKQDPVHGKPATYIFKNKSYPLKGLTFGNISHDSLTCIWYSSRYAGFRELFKYESVMESKRLLSDLPDRCASCYKRLMN